MLIISKRNFCCLLLGLKKATSGKGQQNFMWMLRGGGEGSDLNVWWMLSQSINLWICQWPLTNITLYEYVKLAHFEMQFNDEIPSNNKPLQKYAPPKISSPENKPSKTAFWTNIRAGLIIGLLQYFHNFICFSSEFLKNISKKNALHAIFISFIVRASPGHPAIIPWGCFYNLNIAYCALTGCQCRQYWWTAKQYNHLQLVQRRTVHTF